MNTYHYDEHTKEYLRTEKAFLDPLETKRQGKDVYLLPAGATFIEPIPKDGYAAVWNGEAWEHIEDNRGKEYWLDTDEYGTPARVMDTLGALPEGAVFTEPPKPLALLKQETLRQAQTAFAARRDEVRWVGGYGFDCASEDITNFMAAYTPLLVSGEGTAQYKVWLSDSEKGIVTLTLAELTDVYRTVRTSQLEAYAWYETVKAQIEAAASAEEIAAILTAESLTESAP